MTDQEKTDLLEKKLIEEREEWNNNITELVKSSKRIEELSQSQVFN